jgi:F0F1-type ATP synthase assembly protein I
MAPTNNQPASPRPPAPIAQMAGLGAEIGCLTLMIVLAAVFGGIWLDKLLGTQGVIMIILVLGSAPLALALTFWMAMRTVKKLNPPVQGGKTPGSSQGKPQDEEGGDDW